MGSARDLALLRLAAQHLAGPGLPSAAGAACWMTATQAQDLPGAVAGVALRTQAGTAAGVRAAMDAGQVVRSWPMRGTLHLVPAADLGWMLALGAPRVATATARRRAELGLDDPTVHRAADLAVDALSGGRRLRRRELLAVWQHGGVPTDGQRGAHLVARLAMTGLVCFGPSAGREQALVLLDEWVPRPVRLAGEEALGEWASRYFRGHGPATVADFAWWTGLKVSDARVGLAAAAPRLERLEVEGTTYWMDPATPARLDACRRAARGVFLLPGFDELLLGYRDRGAVLPAEFADRVVPGGNGMFLASVIHRGRVVGTWRRPTGGAAAAPATTPFTTFGRGVEEAIARRWRSYPRDL